MSEHTSNTGEAKAHKAGAFDIRNFIGALLALYGLVLLLTGIFGTDEADLAKSDGVNVNIWTGIALLVAGAIFIGWARLRPVVVPTDTDDQPAGEDDDHHPSH